MSDIFDHKMDALMSELDDMDPVSIFDDRNIRTMSYSDDYDWGERRDFKRSRDNSGDEMQRIVFSVDQYVTESNLSTTFRINCHCEICRDKVKHIHAGRAVHFPKSRCSFQKKGNVYEIMCPRWLVKKNDLEDEVVE